MSRLRDRLLILFGRTLDCETQLQSVHAKLIEERFYSSFEKTLDRVLKHQRNSLVSKREISIGYGLSDKEIRLSCLQKEAMSFLKSNKLKKAIAFTFYSDSRLWFPLHPEWIPILSEMRIKHSKHLCVGLFYASRIMGLPRGLRRWLEIWNIEKKSINLDSPFVDSSSSVYLWNFPPACLRIDTESFVVWLQNGRAVSQSVLHNSLEAESIKSQEISILYQALPAAIRSVRQLIHSMVSCLKTFISAAFLGVELLTSLMRQIDELLASIVISRVPFSALPMKVFIPSTQLISKPLWSYALEKRSVDTILVNYAIHGEFSDSLMNRVIDGIWHLADWKITWATDAAQVKQLATTSEYALSRFEVIGIPAWAGKRFVYSESQPIVSVFDTYIRANLTYSCGRIDEMGWNDECVEEIFLSWVLEACKELNLLLLHKRKRAVPERQTEVSSSVESLTVESTTKYQLLHEDYSAESIISNSKLIISKPNSTIVPLAQQMLKPAIVLDPLGTIPKRDPVHRGAQVVSSKAELRKIMVKSIK